MEDNRSYKEFSLTYGELLDAGYVRTPTLAQVSILYSLGVLFLLYIGFWAQKKSLYPGLLVTEFLLVLMPSLLLLFIFKYDMRKVLRLNKVGPLSLFIIFLIMVFAIPVVSVLNIINLALISKVFGKVIVSSVPTASNAGELIINLLIVGGSAGLCEEIMFRGVLQSGFERLGIKKGILITSLLFGLFHLDFQRFLGTFLLGALIGFIVYRTNSLYAGMFAHFANNSIAVVISYLSNKFMQAMQGKGVGSIDAQPYAGDYFSDLFNMPAGQLIAVFIVWFFILAFCLSILVGLIIALVRITSDKVHRRPIETSGTGKTGMLWLLPGLIFTAIVYIAEGFSLMGINSEIARALTRLIRIG